MTNSASAPAEPVEPTRGPDSTASLAGEPPILEVRDAGKFYALTAAMGRRQKLREIIKAIAGRRQPASSKLGKDTFWAVDGISLTLERSASLGIIGANGAGKSTLMKLMAGIILPDRGEVHRRGNTQAMINLSAGINGEFDAVANIKNACALRGVDRRAIDAKIKQILDFAELGVHATAPAQTYSSGMKARLGFAICAHMDPDLIIIDEALAVGDASFRYKCLRRLNELRRDGTAMVLVSHSMGQIRQFCDQAVWIDAGKVRFSGSAMETVAEYETFIAGRTPRSNEKDGKAATAQTGPAAGDGMPNSLDEIDDDDRFMIPSSPYGLVVLDRSNLKSVALKITGDGPHRSGEPLRLEVTLTTAREAANLNIGLRFYNDSGVALAGFSTLREKCFPCKPRQSVRSVIDIKSIPFAPGTYHLIVSVDDGREKLFRNRLAVLHLAPGDVPAWNAPIILLGSHTTEIQ